MTLPGPPPLPPNRCHWHREQDGTTILIPGCWARIHNPDADCTCGEWSEDTARKTINSMTATIHRERHTIQTLRRALHDAGVPDPTSVLGLISQKDYTARQRRKAMHRAITDAGKD